MKTECKHKTGSTFVSCFWRESCCFVAAMLMGERESRKQGAWFVSFVAGLREEAAVSWDSVFTLFTPHLLLCTHHPDQSEGARTQWRIYGAVRLSLSSPFFTPPPAHSDASGLSQSISLYFLFFWSHFKSCVWRIGHDPWFTSTLKMNCFIDSITLSRLTARTLMFTDYQQGENQGQSQN